jgi:hypothetical protein
MKNIYFTILFEILLNVYFNSPINKYKVLFLRLIFVKILSKIHMNYKLMK